MAIEGIKKVIIPRSALTAVNSDNQYLVRFRIISDDKNLFSQWTPVFVVQDLPIIPITSSSERVGKLITITWQDSTERSAYDVFIKTDDGDYAFAVTTTQRSYSFTHTATNTIKYLIQAEGVVKTETPTLKLFESLEISVV